MCIAMPFLFGFLWTTSAIAATTLWAHFTIQVLRKLLQANELKIYEKNLKI
jgi:hypothetical protein